MRISDWSSDVCSSDLRGAELFVRAIGGRYDRIVAGQPTGFNPLAMPDTAVNRAFLRDWLAVLLKAEGPEEMALIAGAVDAARSEESRLGQGGGNTGRVRGSE